MTIASYFVQTDIPEISQLEDIDKDQLNANIV